MTEAWLRDSLPSLPPVYARVAGHEAIVAMVALGLGVGVVPRLVVEAGAFGDALALRRLSGLPMLEVGLCARAGRLADPLVARFFACIDPGGAAHVAG
jgi:LysR family positive regulator for ilvC